MAHQGPGELHAIVVELRAITGQLNTIGPDSQKM
jgi:hypothetical protein